MSSYIKLSLSDMSNMPSVSIELDQDVPDIYAVLEDLIKPALLACGYLQETVDKIIIEDNPND